LIFELAVPEFASATEEENLLNSFYVLAFVEYDHCPTAHFLVLEPFLMEAVRSLSQGVCQPLAAVGLTDSLRAVSCLYEEMPFFN